jgi:hypothetical protein
MNNDKIKALLAKNIYAEDIISGQLKIDLVEAEQDFEEKSQIEKDHDYSDAMESMDRAYAEGFMDALGYIYRLTYDISFARLELEKERNND